MSEFNSNIEKTKEPEIDQDFLRYLIEYLGNNINLVETSGGIKEFLTRRYFDLQDDYLAQYDILKKDEIRKTVLVNNMSAIFNEVIKIYQQRFQIRWKKEQ
ncbi:hypothetical protein A2733_01255 [Candidatus Nomurabacteria bacterium RIFCSPHIGHO2_01_FULL_40_20]|uniref:Uncharacterized protein n=1 Tax=Candidatus Nomurabacteria bacterium RIFCSPHIGHO2_01_FULL_40_20 TaxID=1801738 RepID=A0A1F6V4N0_9BACT|nr:MAG: hypothetical protein A2733_01255 [Candidatus Nomurabacteria bacterium RIFCSPHIGHO2_01_FULL_40_20]